MWVHLAAVILTVSIFLDVHQAFHLTSRVTRWQQTQQNCMSRDIFVDNEVDEIPSPSPLPKPKVPPPPLPPYLKPMALPLMLAGGLFLFRTSVKPQNRKFADELLKATQEVLLADPAIASELGQSIEAGGVFSSSAASVLLAGQKLDQLVLQFQINGGNWWAQGIVYGVKNEKGTFTYIHTCL